MFHPEGPTLYELAVQALSSVERGYDLLAPKFDHTPFRTPDALIQAALADALGPGTSVDAGLDVCCGTGAALRWLRPVCRTRTVGVDLSSGMLAEARRRMDALPGGCPSVELVRGDALDLPFREEFDLAVCFGAFGHIAEEDTDRFVRSVARALRPGGRFVFVTADAPGTGSSLEVSARVLQARAFNAVMRVRNALWQPPFVMYYLTFLLPRAQAVLHSAGFTVEVRRSVLPPPYTRYALVIATRIP